MSARYEFACQCGRKYPVETSQAGQEIACECGATLKIPTMLKIKRLPLWDKNDRTTEENGDVAATAKRVADPDAPTGDSIQQTKTPRQSRLSSRRFGMIIVGAAILIVSVFFFCCNVPQPNPIDVFYKQLTYSMDGKEVRRDSSPIERSDYDFYFLDDPGTKQTFLIDDRTIDFMYPIPAYLYFDSVKELKLSDNFYDNYEALKARRVIRLVSLGIAAAFGLALSLFALFAPESQKQVGSMRGSAWN